VVNDDSVYYIKRNEKETELVKLASRVDVVAKTQDATGMNCGRLLRWKDDEGRQHEWAMPMELLASDCAAVRARLLSEGLPYLATNRVLRERFSEYLQTSPVNDRYLYIDRIGWHGRTYVLPDQSIGPNELAPVRYQSPSDAEHYWTIRGTAEDWRTHIGPLCTGNSRLLFAVSCAFVGPVLSLLGAESGGVHFIGGTSTGKSTALKVAASVCGEPKFIQSWRNTANGLEAKAVAHNDATLFLDELAQLDPHEASEIAYLLANGQGKGRMSRSIAVRAQLTWRLLFVSSGEISLSEHAAAAGRKTKSGVDVRLLNIPADAGYGMGLFQDLHDHVSPAAFADRLCELARTYYGATFRSFVRKLVAKRTESERAIGAVRRKFLKCVPVNAVGEIKRAADRFALIAAAGELATCYRLTGWEKAAALNAARLCYQDWLEQRGTTGSAELYKAVRQVRAFLEKHGSSRFQFVHGGSKAQEETIVHNRVGFRRINKRTGESEFLILPETFKDEVCKGFSYLTVINELECRGFARCQRPAATIKTPLPGFQNDVHVFCIFAAILESDPNADAVAPCIGTVGTTV
jgi:putative DNA primase/helicase